MNIFLAIAIDKLSEVNSVKEDSSHRSEQREEQRREREEQLLALKNPTQPSSLSQTLRRVLVFYSANLKQQEEQQLTRRKRSRRARGSLTIPLPKTDRSISMPHTMADIRRQSYASSRAASDPVSPSAYNEDRKDSINVATYLHNIVPQKVSSVNPLTKFFKTQSQHSSMIRSATIELDRFETTPTNDTSMSHDKEPDESSCDVLPVEPVTVLEESTTFDCSNSLESQSLPPQPSPSHSRVLAAPADVSIARLVRQSSLEEVDQIVLPGSEEIQSHRRPKKCLVRNYIDTIMMMSCVL